MFCWLIAAFAYAQSYTGPYVSYARRAPAELFGVESEASRATAVGLVPLPIAAAGGMFVLRGQYEAFRLLDSEIPDDESLLSGGAVGALYLAHPAEGRPPFFVYAARHGFWSDPGMFETLVGFDVTRWLSAIRLSDGDRLLSRLGLRYRHFPHGDRYVPFIRHEILTPRGIRIILGIPDEVTIESTWGRVTGRLGIEWQSRQYLRNKVWWEGYTETVAAGAIVSLFAHLVVGIESGVDTEHAALYNEEGVKLAKDRSKPATWGRLSLSYVPQ